MKNLNNDLFDLVFSHISIAGEFLDKNKFISQLDYLTFWVNSTKMSEKSPFGEYYIRDNPNWELTNYDGVYQLVESDKIVLQYVRDGYSPVAILQWYKMNIKGVEKWKISVYGKGLRLYYCGFLDWLPDYIDFYCDDVIRADLCWDSPNPIDPAVVTKLKNTVTYGDDLNWSYKGFGNKKSPLFIRIYDKTLDLKKDHNSMAWLYPDWYIKSCRRIECKFTGRYASSMSALQWLGLIYRDGKVQKQVESKRNYLKSAFYNLLMYVDFVPNKELQYKILSSVNVLCVSKLKKLKDFINLYDKNEKI